MYECPNCGGNLKFNITSQDIACPSCDAHFDPYEIQKEKDAVEDNTFEVTIFTCPQCAGEIYSTDESAAEFCSFCGASTILNSRLMKENRPKYIIPFTKTKEDCKKAYIKMVRRAIFAPKQLKDKKHIDSFRGIYMPYWVYDIAHHGPFTVKAKDEYRKGDYIYTDHYKINGNVDCSYEGISYDASSSFEDNISGKIAPYQVEGMKEFTPSFLSGFYADTADVENDIYTNDAYEFASDVTRDYVMADSSMHKYHVTSTDRDFLANLPTKLGKIDAAMFPVWFMSYQKDGRVAYATVNGQTGKVVADLPVDFKKYIFGSLLLALPIYGFLNVAFTFTPSVLLTFVAIVAICSLILHKSEVSAIRKRDLLVDDKGMNARKAKDKKHKDNSSHSDIRQKNLELYEDSKNAESQKNKTYKTINVIGTVILAIGVVVMFHFDVPLSKMSWLYLLGAGLLVFSSGADAYEELGENNMKYGLSGALLSIALASVILFIHPIQDTIYYGGAVVCMIAELFTLLDVIKKHNLATTRRLPQFDKKGGDDRA